ncbi:PLP-dependent cysteine synthase family protein [Bradyrhizobium sp. U87765 SZCCT0131]|uniref:PLP-dependent cysteine synthase family protein n=1 Tax=unclassified Bradyrhizobium TaxID=2631580 RepID=UPI001BABA50B|nr:MULTISPECIES: PLP-dependent cysteine synthase family protein [unclassified Bradyrhizobium]MBR1221749.1 PLP-dependent cysteine synthase family protein [Bradyrhizobium sp. U87765 SZCCT0131]MBR1264328.1 PLP-dependent cysteine synthase family protein [Bradyrhizobium sp. U87765 SZCCT0134]MBR1304765.1 PLP-dependent cysteine synthase family protein [Bradyrhizobium sp. U87765 SZCCT0110]MBR1324101.1 PLP-dependent cysteine synthase family protein [Bradyrhizobium sp. U87765 SZCCT0109]MBR1346694.1 PLP-
MSDDPTVFTLTVPITGPAAADRDWATQALGLIETDQRRSADTHLLHFDAPALKGLSIYLKDESTHPTGSLKHRLARSLFLYGICNGRIRGDTPIVEASSGSTAVSEAYFARLLGLPFYAVMPGSTSREKIEAIERQGGHCHLAQRPSEIYAEATSLAERLKGVYLDQFTFAERATDWRGNNNIAESIFQQMSGEPHAVPAVIVMSAGTGGTTATIGRYIRYRRFSTRLCVVDVENSVFFDAYRQADRGVTSDLPSRIEGIGRPRVEPSFLSEVIDEMIRIPDAASLAAMRVLSRRLGRKVGGSTGTNFFGLCLVAARMQQAGQEGSLVTLICDGGDRYLGSYYNDGWIAAQNLGLGPYERAIDRFLDGEPLVVETV